jgi:hypothetical protein
MHEKHMTAAFWLVHPVTLLLLGYWWGVTRPPEAVCAPPSAEAIEYVEPVLLAGLVGLIVCCLLTLGAARLRKAKTERDAVEG